MCHHGVTTSRPSQLIGQGDTVCIRISTNISVLTFCVFIKLNMSSLIDVYNSNYCHTLYSSLFPLLPVIFHSNSEKTNYPCLPSFYIFVQFGDKCILELLTCTPRQTTFSTTYSAFMQFLTDFTHFQS